MVIQRSAIVAGACLLLARAAAAQQPDPWDYHNPALTRPQLEQVAARFDAAAHSSAYSAALREQAQLEADSARARLRTGDIRAGDRIRMRVDGQQALSDTFPVVDGPALQLPVVGTVPLTGVLRSELHDRLSQSVNAVYRGSVVTTQLLTRVAVLGGVGRPGFYALPPEALLDDAIGAAGGLSPDGRLAGAYIERGRLRVWQGDSLQLAMRERRTLGDLGVEPGDRIVVPRTLPSDPYRTVQTISYVVSLPLTIFAVLRLF